MRTRGRGPAFRDVAGVQGQQRVSGERHRQRQSVHRRSRSGDSPGFELSLGPGTSFQLKAYYSAKFWKFDRSCQDYADPDDANGVKHAYVSGHPTLGAGWTLELGYVDTGLEVENYQEVIYHSPDGARRVEGDGSRLRVTRNPATGTASSYTVEFPDGTKQTFAHLYDRPRPVIGTSYDFNDTDWDILVNGWPVSPGPRYGLTSMTDAFGQNLLTVNYVAEYGSPDAWHVANIVLNGGRTITYNWITKDVQGVVWSVLGSISLPGPSGHPLPVSFDYVGGAGTGPAFPRSSFDNSIVTNSPCPNPGNALVPLLERITLGDPSIHYDLAYLLPPADPADYAGTLKRITLPTQGTIEYTYFRTSAASVGGSCQDLENASTPAIARSQPLVGSGLRFQDFIDKSAGVSERRETDPFNGIVSIVSYDRYECVPFKSGSFTDPDETRIARRVNVTVEDRNGVPFFVTKHMFHVGTQSGDGTGFELERRYYADSNSEGTPIRTEINCYSQSGGTAICGFLDANGQVNVYSVAQSVLRQKGVIWYGINPTGGGICPQGPTACKANTSSDYVALTNRFRTTEVTSTFGTLTRTSTTYWNPQSGAPWLLDLFDRRTETEGSSSVTRYFYFDRTTGFLNGSAIWEPVPSGDHRLFLTCQYPSDSGTGTVGSDVGLVIAAYGTEPVPSPCPAAVSAFSTIGTSQDLFARQFSHQNGLLTLAYWMSSPTAGANWYSSNYVRDGATGLNTSSFDTAGQQTGYTYDALGRLTCIVPGGGTCTQSATGEIPTAISYDSTTQTTVARAGGTGLSTWGRYLYDGFGRLIREIRQMPVGSPSAYALRINSYDDLGRNIFVSEWVSCPNPGACATQMVSGSSGTTSSGFDPFGRAGAITRADGSTTTISYTDTDRSIAFSDTQRTVTVNNVNGTCSFGSCSGGTSASTTYRYDALGRLISVTEPGGDLTSYTYDVNDKLIRVFQGSQLRTFAYDAAGNLRSETTPERGTISYEDDIAAGLLGYGSLGNLLRESLPGVVRGYCYDFAGRLRFVRTNEGAAGATCGDPATTQVYLQNNYDENPSATNRSLGKLTSRGAFNYAVAPNPTVTDTFVYGELGGRLSQQTTQISGSSSVTKTQSWKYNSLGLVAHHYHPQTLGDPLRFVVSTVYDNGLPVAQYVNGIPMVTNVTYQPSGALGSYTTGVGIADVTTTIGQDGSLPRPSSIATAGAATNFATGAYGYDGASNMTGMGLDGFSYDVRSRLCQANLAGAGSEFYTYDSYGNLVTKAFTDPSTCVASTSRSNNRVASAEYDLGISNGRGNLTNYAGQTFSWDGLDRMVSNQGSQLYKYVYDGSDERVARIPQSGDWTFMFRDEGKRIASEFVTGTPSRDNAFLGNQLMVSYANAAVGNNGPGWVFYASDHLGTPRILTDVAGNNVEPQFRRYWPYGEAVATQGSFQILRFATMEFDAEGGTGGPASDRYYDHARSHVGGLGRFLTVDILHGEAGDPQSWNRYTYALGNPLKYVDPYGLWGSDLTYISSPNDTTVLDLFRRFDNFLAFGGFLRTLSSFAATDARFSAATIGMPDASVGSVPGEPADPFSLNALEQLAAPLGDLPYLQEAADLSTGFGDTITGGLTAFLRAGGAVDSSSGFYKTGVVAGYVWDAAYLATGVAYLAGVRTKVAMHGPNHPFPMFGGRRLPHLQLNVWRQGVPGSAWRARRVPLPMRLWKWLTK